MSLFLIIKKCHYLFNIFVIWMVTAYSFSPSLWCISHITIYICTTVNAVLKTISTNCKT